MYKVWVHVYVAIHGIGAGLKVLYYIYTLYTYLQLQIIHAHTLVYEFILFSRWPFQLSHSMYFIPTRTRCINTLRPRQNGCLFTDDIFRCIFLNENARILHKISLKFVPKVRINNIPALIQIMAWRRPGDKPLSEPMMVSLPTHVCVTRPQWVKFFLAQWHLWKIIIGLDGGFSPIQ